MSFSIRGRNNGPELVVREDGGVISRNEVYERDNLVITATPAALAANDTIVWLKNNQQGKVLFIDEVRVTGDAAGRFTIHEPTGTSPAGTALTVRQKDFGVTPAYDISAYFDETANAQGSVFEERYVRADVPEVLVNLAQPYRVPFGKEFAIDSVPAQTLAYVVVECHLEDE